MVYYGNLKLTRASTAGFDIMMTMVAEGKIKEDTIDCPQFVAFEGASHGDSFASFNLGQMTERIHGESNAVNLTRKKHHKNRIDNDGRHFMWSRQ